jgi:ABC-type lipoprotein release transport system permease subunit
VFKNYIKIAIRNQLRQKTFAFINIFGLALGMSCAIILGLWCNNELNYESHHVNAGRIYRIADNITNDNGSTEKLAVTPAMWAPTLKEEFPTSLFPEAPFDFTFMDDDLKNMYQAEEKMSFILDLFGIAAILISCIGLLGLATLTAEQRTKEIGIRKVLGASITSIIFKLTKDFTKWILIANLITAPLAFYAVHKWLQNFAYRIEISWPREITGLDFLNMMVQNPITGLHFLFNNVFISRGWWMFALAGGIALAIALATVSFQAIKAATANPVESLRYE